MKTNHTWNVYAQHGDVIIKGVGDILTRDEAIELVRKLASAIQMAGDMSDPYAVFLVEAAQAKP